MPKSLLPPVIGVDLGASFTKVSYRPAWNDGSRYTETSQMVVIEGSPLVPSIVIYSDRNGKWLFGDEASDYLPTPEDRVFSNWKAALYSQRLDHKVDGAMDAASRFFEWLGQQLRATGIPVKDSRIKICLPAFDGAAEPGRMLVERMKRCGWAGLAHSTIEEPRANTVGMFGHGKNAAHQSGSGGEVLPFYMGNFPMGGFVLTHLRNHALTNGPRFVSYLIIDIGSFTADLSLAVIDAKRDGDCIQQATQHSFELGLVDHYEKPLFEALLKLKGLEWNDLNFRDRERIKNVLNTESRITIATPGHGNIIFGTAQDRDTAARLAEDFARQLSTVIERFVKGESVPHVILTGGGVAITKLRDKLRHQLESDGMHVLPVSLEGNAEPAPAGQRTATISWEETGETLERLATAIGASSVLMDLKVHEPAAHDEEVVRPESPWVICSCNGGNKDCARCGGLGTYERS
jgi:hypothetical protein